MQDPIGWRGSKHACGPLGRSMGDTRSAAASGHSCMGEEYRPSPWACAEAPTSKPRASRTGRGTWPGDDPGLESKGMWAADHRGGSALRLRGLQPLRSARTAGCGGRSVEYRAVHPERRPKAGVEGHVGSENAANHPARCASARATPASASAAIARNAGEMRSSTATRRQNASATGAASSQSDACSGVGSEIA